MLLETNGPVNSDREPLSQLQAGKVLILQKNTSAALFIQKAFHVELVTPGSAVGGSFDQQVTGFHGIGDISFSLPTNAQELQDAIQHRQNDIDQMLRLCKEKDSLKRTRSILEMLVQRFGLESVKTVPVDFLVNLTGTNHKVVAEAWNGLLNIEASSVLPESSDAVAELPPSAEPHKNRFSQNRPLVWGLVVLGLAGVGMVAYTLLNAMAHKPSANVSSAMLPELKTISALGFIEPQGEVIRLSAPAFMEGTRVEQLLVRQGDPIQKGELIAVLDNKERLAAILDQSRQSANIAQAKLRQVQAGSKLGDIQAQDAKYRSSKAELEGQVRAQQASIASLESDLEGERSTQEALILQVKAELGNAKTECARYESLLQGGAVSASARDNICLVQSTAQERLAQATNSLSRIVNTRQQQIRQAKANLARTIDTLENDIAATASSRDAVAEVRPVDVQLATQEVMAANAAVKKAQADLDQAYVRSPINGRILKIHSWPGELVNQQSGIAEVGRTEQMYVSANVYETDIARVKKGQTAKIRADRVVGELSGTVEQVGLQIGTPNILGTDPVKDADVRVVEVKIRLNPQSSAKVENLTNLQVNVVIDTNS